MLFYRPVDQLQPRNKSSKHVVNGLKWKANNCYFNASVHALAYAYEIWSNERKQAPAEDDENGGIDGLGGLGEDDMDVQEYDEGTWENK